MFITGNQANRKIDFSINKHGDDGQEKLVMLASAVGTSSISEDRPTFFFCHQGFCNHIVGIRFCQRGSELAIVFPL